MSKAKKEVDAWASAQLGQKLEESTPSDMKAIKEAGLLPPSHAKTLAKVESDYNPNAAEKYGYEDYDGSDDPTRAEYTDKWQEKCREAISEVISKAVYNGKDHVINRFIKVVERDADISDLHPVTRFNRWVCREAAVNYIYAAPGHGKTDLGVLISQQFYMEYESKGSKARIATNVQSTAEAHDHVKYIGSFPELQSWLQNKDGKKHFLFDEAGHHAHAFGGNNAEVVNTLGSMIKLIRKHQGSITIIGHTGKDIVPEIRTLADAVEKEDKKTAVVYEEVEDREGINQLDRFENIPKTKWHYETNESSEWSWGKEEDDEEDIEMIIGRTYKKAKKGDINTQEDVAEIFDVSQGKVSSSYREFKDSATS